MVGLLRMDPLRYTLVQGAYAALAGLGGGFVVLGILPFIERVFRVTTGMTLLEYQNHPLLRRMALEAPGTYQHSLQVASICEDAAASRRGRLAAVPHGLLLPRHRQAPQAPLLHREPEPAARIAT